VSEWNTVELGDVAKFVRGINFKPDDVVPVGTPGSVACMRTKNVQSELDCSDVWGVDERFVRRDDQFLETGDILVSSANSWNLVGKCCWIPELPWRATFGGFVSVLRTHRMKTDPRFLYRWFSSDRIQTTLRSFGQQTTNISNLNTDRCIKLQLPLPSMSEQRRIAELLDRAEALRTKRRDALVQLDTVTQSIFHDLFANPKRSPNGVQSARLSNVTTRITDGTHLTPRFVKQGVPFIFVKNVRNGAIDFQTDKFISEDEHQALYKRCPVEQGDVLYTTVGATYGQAASVGPFTKFAFQRHIAHLKPDPAKILPQFLGTVMQFPVVKEQADRWARGAAQPTINLKELRDFEIPLPPLTLQREFANRVALVEGLRTSYHSSLAMLDALFSVLQHRAFRGEL
jgi:type I restriction enzyme S subunit